MKDCLEELKHNELLAQVLDLYQRSKLSYAKIWNLDRVNFLFVELASELNSNHFPSLFLFQMLSGVNFTDIQVEPTTRKSTPSLKTITTFKLSNFILQNVKSNKHIILKKDQIKSQTLCKECHMNFDTSQNPDKTPTTKNHLGINTNI